MEAANTRREFFKKVFFYTSAGALVHVLAKNVSLAGDLKPIDMSGKKRTDADNKECIGVATGLGYVENLDKALKEKKATKADRPGAAGKVFKAAEQTCESCMFYNYKKDGQATCQLLPKCLVQAKGSCNSWTPKA